MSKLKKSQNVNKSTEETAIELDRKMSVDTELIGKFTTQQVAAAMSEKKKQYEKKIKKLEKDGTDGVSAEFKKTGTRGGGRASKKRKIHGSDNYEVQNTQTICVSIRTNPKEHPLELLEGKKPRSR